MKDKITIHGGCSWDYVYATKDASTLPDQAEYQSPAWDVNTIMYAEFTDDISGSNYKSAAGLISGYSVYREGDEDKILKFVAAIPAKENIVEDYGVKSTEAVSYRIYPILQSESGVIYSSPVVSERVHVSYDTWTLMTIKHVKDNMYTVGDYVWNFYLDAEPDEYSHNIAANEQNTDGKYPHIHRGNQNYISGGLTAYAGYVDDNGAYREPQFVFDKWDKFLSSRDPKLLTDPYGHKMIVEITSSSHSVDNYHAIPTKIKFSFSEIKDASDISVYRSSTAEV